MAFFVKHFLALSMCLVIPVTVFGSDKDLCPDKILDKGTIRGVYVGLIEQDGMLPQIGIRMDGDAEPTLLFADRDTAAKVFPDAQGKLVSANYNLRQYWNEAEMWCFRGDALVDGKILGNAPPSPQKQACPRKVLDTRTVTGVYHGLVNNDIDVYSIALGMPGSDDYLVQSSQKEADKWFADAEGKNFSVTYQTIQFWDERDGECSRMEKILDVKPAAGMPQSADKIAGTYALLADGLSGELVLGAPNVSGLRSIRVNTVNEANLNFCEYEGSCLPSGKNGFVCSQSGEFSGDMPADPGESPVRLRLNGDIMEITAQNSDMCGNGATMLGKYRSKK